MTCENRLNSVTTNKIYFHWGPVCCLKLFTQWFCAHCRFNNEKLLETHPSALYISQQQLGKHVFSSLCLPSPSCSFFQSIRTMCLGADQYLSSCVSYSCALWNISISCSHLSPMQTLFFFFIFAGCSAFDSEKPQNNPFFFLSRSIPSQMTQNRFICQRLPYSWRTGEGQHQPDIQVLVYRKNNYCSCAQKAWNPASTLFFSVYCKENVTPW